MAIENTSGINAQMAQKIVQAASEFESDITLRYLKKEVDLKSILGIMSLAVLEGARVEIEAKGVDAEEAITAIQATVSKGGIK
ncbi:MAG: HPr family phosphocarrier protein [Bacilli bacterium]|nr:HPr family phosphocarrier protein [Bacilli bacterium]